MGAGIHNAPFTRLDSVASRLRQSILLLVLLLSAVRIAMAGVALVTARHAIRLAACYI